MFGIRKYFQAQLAVGEAPSEASYDGETGPENEETDGDIRDYYGQGDEFDAPSPNPDDEISAEEDEFETEMKRCPPPSSPMSYRSVFGLSYTESNKTDDRSPETMKEQRALRRIDQQIAMQDVREKYF